MSEPMTPTQRVQAEAGDGWTGDAICVPARLAYQLASELEAAQKALNQEREDNWTASLCDRVNEFLREHRQACIGEATNGPECSAAIQMLHGYAGSMLADLTALRSDKLALQESLTATQRAWQECDAAKLALEKDKERLDWLESFDNDARVYAKGMELFEAQQPTMLRQAIDSAIASQNPTTPKKD